MNKLESELKTEIKTKRCYTNKRSHGIKIVNIFLAAQKQAETQSAFQTAMNLLFGTSN